MIHTNLPRNCVVFLLLCELTRSATFGSKTFIYFLQKLCLRHPSLLALSTLVVTIYSVPGSGIVLASMIPLCNSTYWHRTTLDPSQTQIMCSLGRNMAPSMTLDITTCLFLVHCPSVTIAGKKH